MNTDVSAMQRVGVYLTSAIVSRLMPLTETRQRSFSYVVQQAVTYWLSQGAPDVKPEGRLKRGKV